MRLLGQFQTSLFFCEKVSRVQKCNSNQNQPMIGFGFSLLEVFMREKLRLLLFFVRLILFSRLGLV